LKNYILPASLTKTAARYHITPHFWKGETSLEKELGQTKAAFCRETA